MNVVQPIRDKGVVLDIGEYLKEKSMRNYVMYMIGIYSGLRIGDILNLRVRDVRGVDSITVTEQKTGKEKPFPVGKELKKVLTEYVRDKKDYEYLIKSNMPGVYNSPITRQQAYKILRDAGEKFGVENLGTHSMRKTFGYHFYKQTGNLAMLMKIFNHSSESVTLAYIGVEQDDMMTAMKKFSYR